MILSEFDSGKDAIINPWDVVYEEAGMVEEMPKVAVTCFEGKTFERLVKLLDGKKIAELKNANESFPVYRVQYKGKSVALYMSDMGAPGAGALLDEVYALGVETIIAFGSCGALDKTIEDCSVIIPNSAVRDEGLSYHYAPPSDEIIVNSKYIPEFTDLLDEIKCSYQIGKVWTTDAFYRETKAKMERRKAADCLDGEKWDRRSLSSDVKFSEKDKFAELARELAVRI